MLTHHKAVIAALTTVPRMGYQMWSVNITTLTSRMKVDRTEMATLKDVNLFQISASFLHNHRWTRYVRL